MIAIVPVGVIPADVVTEVRTTVATNLHARTVLAPVVTRMASVTVATRTV